MQKQGRILLRYSFSFLTIPLGFALKHLHNSSLKGCIDHLHESDQDLHEQALSRFLLREPSIRIQGWPCGLIFLCKLQDRTI